jgi:hypothetical protein
MDNGTGSTMSCPLAQYITSQFSNFEQNRSPLQEKWDRNRAAFQRDATVDPKGTWKASEKAEAWQSDTFVGVTRQKVVAAVSLVLDMILQGGQIPFMLKPSATFAQVLAELPEEVQEEARENIEHMEALIRDQFRQCHADRQMIKIVLSIAIYGEAYAKRFVFARTKRRFVQEEQAVWGEDISHQNQPAIEYVPVLDIYRDLETDDLEKSAGIIQRQLVSPYELRQKIGIPYWREAMIENVLKDAKSRRLDSGTDERDTSSLPVGQRGLDHRQKTIRLLEFWGRVPTRVIEDFEARGEDLDAAAILSSADDDQETDGNEVYIMAVVADQRVVRYVRTDPDEMPYYRTEWEVNLDDIGGSGVADSLEWVQKIMNGAMRSFEDNKKLTSNLITAVKREYLLNDEGLGKLKPGMQLDVSPECDDARKAVMPIVLPDVGEGLLSLLELARVMADEESSIPRAEQGQQSGNQQTAYELQQRLSKSGKYLGQVIRLQDDNLIEPVVEDFYRYNMLDPDVQQGKGDYAVAALGFTSFENRVLRLQKIQQLLGLVLADGELRGWAQMRWLLNEIAKGLDMDPDEVWKSEKEKGKEGPNPADVMAMKQLEANLEKTQTETAAKQEEVGIEKQRLALDGQKVDIERDKLALDRARGVSDIEDKAMRRRVENRQAANDTGKAIREITG